MVLLSVTWSGPLQRDAPVGLDTGPRGDANDGAASLADVEKMRKRSVRSIGCLERDLSQRG
jgi:hypothetical protein